MRALIIAAATPNICPTCKWCWQAIQSSFEDTAMNVASAHGSISLSIAEQMERSSWIRRMFEIGIQLRKERGAENVFDFSLGNPEVEPPAAVLQALRQVVSESRPRSHGYMPNAGFPETRAAIARNLTERTGLPFTADDILMTTGAAGAINTVLKAVLDPGDEVIVLRPYFPEYRFYIENHGGHMVEVDTDEHFQPDIEAIAAAITPRTKALILNSPNNPTGAVYSAEVLRQLDAIVPDTMLVISDEPYRPLTFDGLTPPETFGLLRRAVVAWSWSKAMGDSRRAHRISGDPTHPAGRRGAPQCLHLRQSHLGVHQCTGALAISGGARAGRDGRRGAVPGEARHPVRCAPGDGIRRAASAGSVLRFPANTARR